MRCLVCNTRLTDEEATTKDPDTNAFLDECSSCTGYLMNDVDELMDGSYEDYG